VGAGGAGAGGTGFGGAGVGAGAGFGVGFGAGFGGTGFARGIETRGFGTIGFGCVTCERTWCGNATERALRRAVAAGLVPARRITAAASAIGMWGVVT
jgi:hypothetical protein